MEKGDFRREKLAELGLERLQRPPERGWQARSKNLNDRWHRFNAGGWERGFFAVACAVAVVVAIIGVVALATRGGGNDGNPAASASGPHSTAARPAGVKATPTAIVIGVPVIPTRRPTDAPTDEPNRQDCGAIRGTEYRSAAERDWYVQNCSASVQGPPTQPPASTGHGITPAQPTAPPTTSPGISNGEAISLAVGWMTTSASKSYSVDSGTCSAVQLGDHWVVSCTGRLAGCQNATCETPLDVCVFADRRVVSAAAC